MTRSRNDTDRTSLPDFENELTRVVDEARHDNVPVTGTYDMRTPRPDAPDYTVEITEITKRSHPWNERA